MDKALSWLIPVAVLAALGYYVINRVSENTQKREAAVAQKVDARREIEQMADRWKASTTWEASLTGGGSTRISEVMSAELQQLWLGHPILFVGTLEDISQTPDGSFQVVAKHDGALTSQRLILSAITIRVVCPAAIGARLLKAHTEKGSMFPGVAVVVQIASISQERVAEAESDSSLVKVGIGICLDAAYIGSGRIWNRDDL
jgi:hypothetical protein